MAADGDARPTGRRGSATPAPKSGSGADPARADARDVAAPSCGSGLGFEADAMTMLLRVGYIVIYHGACRNVADPFTRLSLTGCVPISPASGLKNSSSSGVARQLRRRLRLALRDRQKLRRWGGRPRCADPIGFCHRQDARTIPRRLRGNDDKSLRKLSWVKPEGRGGGAPPGRCFAAPCRSRPMGRWSAPSAGRGRWRR